MAVGTFFPVDAIRIRVADSRPDVGPGSLDRSRGSPGIPIRVLPPELPLRTRFYAAARTEFQFAVDFMTRFLATLLEVAESEGVGLEEAFTRLGQPFDQRLLDTLAALLEHPNSPPQADSDSQGTEGESPSRVLGRLADLLADEHFEGSIRRNRATALGVPNRGMARTGAKPFPFNRGERNSDYIPFFVSGVSRGRTHFGFGFSGGAGFETPGRRDLGSANRQWEARDSSSERSGE